MQNNDGWDVRNALHWIRNCGDQRFNKMDREMAEIVLSAIEANPKGVTEHFRVYSKGTGVLCNRKQGIKSNEFIIEYFGEIYPPWRWFEKQDVSKPLISGLPSEQALIKSSRSW